MRQNFRMATAVCLAAAVTILLLPLIAAQPAGYFPRGWISVRNSCPKKSKCPDGTTCPVYDLKVNNKEKVIVTARVCPIVGKTQTYITQFKVGGSEDCAPGVSPGVNKVSAACGATEIPGGEVYSGGNCWDSTVTVPNDITCQYPRNNITPNKPVYAHYTFKLGTKVPDGFRKIPYKMGCQLESLNGYPAVGGSSKYICPPGEVIVGYAFRSSVADVPEFIGGTQPKNANQAYRETARFTGLAFKCAKPGGVGGGQGDPHFSGYDGTRYDFHGHDGGVFNLLSHQLFQVNALMTDVGKGRFEGTWMMGLGFRLKDSMGVETTIKITVDQAHSKYYEQTDHKGVVRAMTYGNVRDHLAIEINGEVDTDALYSGQHATLESDDVTVWFPDETKSAHEDDPWDGTIMVITTPDMEFDVNLESEGVFHLDVNTHIRSTKVKKMHGVLGQTLSWVDAEEGEKELEGEETDYLVRGGLLGRDFKYSLFGKEEQRKGRLLLSMDDEEGADYTGYSSSVVRRLMAVNTTARTVQALLPVMTEYL